MSRPIKFRAWCNELKRMFEVSEMVVGPTVTTWVKDKDYSRLIVHGENGVLMQFTGLHDKNGKEIWEGDIIREVQDEPSKSLPKIIETKIPTIFFERWVSTSGEVLGNIYENPDLLKP